MTNGPLGPAGSPSARTLLAMTTGALLAAAVILITTVLPAEYGIDPTGVGRALGLTAISSPPMVAAGDSAVATSMLAPVLAGPVSHFGAAYRTDSVELVVGPYQFVEYKYRLEQGATMVYSWSANLLPIYDFHADPDGTPAPDPVSFDKQAKQHAAGSYTAAFPGIHGWYWENPGAETMTIKLTTSGFYSAATEFRPNRRRIPHEVKPVSTP